MGREAEFHYRSVLGTAEGAQKAGRMKMGSEEMWTVCPVQFRLQSYSYESPETVSADILELRSTPEDCRTKFWSVS